MTLEKAMEIARQESDYPISIVCDLGDRWEFCYDVNNEPSPKNADPVTVDKKTGSVCRMTNPTREENLEFEKAEVVWRVSVDNPVITLEEARAMVERPDNDFPLDVIFDLGDKWVFVFDRGHPAPPGGCGITINKGTGEKGWFGVPPMENLNLSAKALTVWESENYKKWCQECEMRIKGLEVD